MIWRPQPGQRVELHYRKSMRATCPHKQRGKVMISGGKKIVNALVSLDDNRLMIVPRGNLTECEK